LGAHEARNGLRGLPYLLFGLVPTGTGRVDEAVREMLVEQLERERLQRSRGRGHLREDVDAVLVVLDHALQAADLTLDAAEPLQVTVLVLHVPDHVSLPGTPNCHRMIPRYGMNPCLPPIM